MHGIAQQTVRVFAPASVGNMGPGLDILGLALRGIGDTVTATVVDHPGVRIAESGHPELPSDAMRHTSGIAAREVLRRAEMEHVGIELHVEKGLPLSGGQGGSAASAVAGAVATNALLATPIDRRAVLEACLTAESAVAGRHLDNLAPSLLGGCILIRSVDDLDTYRVPTPPELRIVLVHPHQRMRTADARAVLPQQIGLQTVIAQTAHVASLVLALTQGDFDALRVSVNDGIAEPARASLLPGFANAKASALQAGALGCSISGSGPTAFAFARGDVTARAVARAMEHAYAEQGIGSDVLVTTVDTDGARIVT
jgi:homoserine kinase